MKRTNAQNRQQLGLRIAATLWVTGTLAVCCGCTALPLHRFKPIVAPPVSSSSCQGPAVLKAGETSEFHYILPKSARSDESVPSKYMTTSRAAAAAEPLFESYHSKVRTAVGSKLPPGLQQHKVTKVLIDYFIAVSGEAQLDAQIADGTLADTRQIALERKSIQKHGGAKNISHGEMKDFATKLFEFHLQPGAARLTPLAVNMAGLSAEEKKNLANRTPLDEAAVAYIDAYYHGNFVDRMSSSISKPNLSLKLPVALSITDADIAAAETVLLEFVADAVDPTPVMGDTASAGDDTTFYPGGVKGAGARPTALDRLADYEKLPDDLNARGINTQNVWILRYLANGASDGAATVGGLIANTPGGISFGLGVLGKVSIGDNQTLSVLVKTAASRLALRLTLTSSYLTLRNVCFPIPEPKQ